MDTRTPEQLEYEKYLYTLPRSQRRRILHGHMKRIQYAETENIRKRDLERREHKIQRQMEAKNATA